MNKTLVTFFVIAISITACSKSTPPATPTTPMAPNYTAGLKRTRTWRHYSVFRSHRQGYPNGTSFDTTSITFAIRVINIDTVSINNTILGFVSKDTGNGIIIFNSGNPYFRHQLTYYYKADSLHYYEEDGGVSFNSQDDYYAP